MYLLLFRQTLEELSARWKAKKEENQITVIIKLKIFQKNIQWVMYKNESERPVLGTHSLNWAALLNSNAYSV